MTKSIFFILWFAGVVASSMLVLSCAGKPRIIVCTEIELDEESRIGDLWANHYLSCDIGTYSIQVPADQDGHPPELMVRGPEGTIIFTASKNSRSLWENRMPMVSLNAFESNDGALSLTYDVYSADRTRHITVIDRNLDGQADVRIRWSKGMKSEWWYWIEDAWYLDIDSVQGRAVLVDGVPRSYDVVDGVPVFSNPEE